ncbi:SulP family inorganic anion transporter [Spectribacter hydrogenoxidans]|uniref:SulP family inorganic anion transporter n=1 Tax=Spectribacter hydrogenoxidans TaxID=3075608 RepID=A0ABU3C1C8_9GAMM|nr:SulP family inorganic anion transporter [Salinisphaera sp. W335]MDT0635164.1 SulP family inorganic anion transporter [Salinisphaera sp. W335]
MAFLDTSNLKGDLFGGVTAGIVALPLALAFGEASGAGPIAGLWGAILVGFFASLFGGTGPQVSGPTGPMVVVFAGLYASLADNPTLVFTSVVLAGGMLVVMGVLGLGRYIRLVPYPVVSGFMSGIGCIIIALQLSRLLGHEPADTGTIPAMAAVPGALMSPNLSAFALGAATLAIVFTWPAKLGKFLPGPLAALIICTLAGLVLPAAPVLGDIPTGLPDFIIPSLTQDSLFVVLEAAIILAVLCGIDSLLTSLVADNMTRERHDSNRELIGQGIGNTVAGFFGAIPGAGATMRTVVNIRTGGSTKISGMTHAVLLLAIVLVLSPLASQIPHAVLAGILIKVGYDIIDWRYLMHAHRGPRWDLVLMALVLGLTVFVDLITAVAVGVVLAALAFVKEIADLQLASLESDTDDVNDAETADLLKSAGGRVMLFDFSGPLSFGAAADLGHHVRERSSNETSVVIMDFSHVPHLDVSAAKAVETIAEDANDYGRSLFITGANQEVQNVLAALDVTQLVPTDHWFTDRVAALRTAIAELDDPPAGAVPQPG